MALIFQPAYELGPGGKAVVAQIHAKAKQMFGIYVQR